MHNKDDLPKRRLVDAIEFRKKLEEEIKSVKDHPEYFDFDTVIEGVIQGLEIAIADLGDMESIDI